jgi:hypothetical protein
MGKQAAPETVEPPDEPKPAEKVYCVYCETEQLPGHECFPVEPMSCW